MILRSTSPESAEVEQKLYDWFIENFGEEDTKTFLEWLWGREKGERYVLAMQHIAKETAARGKPFFHNILEHAKLDTKTKEQRDAEEELLSAMLPVIERVKTNIQGHRGAEDAREEGLREIRVRLRETLRRMFPSKHRATLDGAIMCGTLLQGGFPTLNCAAVVAALMKHEDALATTAASSHGVTYDR